MNSYQLKTKSYLNQIERVNIIIYTYLVYFLRLTYLTIIFLGQQGRVFLLLQQNIFFLKTCLSQNFSSSKPHIPTQFRVLSPDIHSFWRSLEILRNLEVQATKSSKFLPPLLTGEPHQHKKKCIHLYIDLKLGGILLQVHEITPVAPFPSRWGISELHL